MTRDRQLAERFTFLLKAPGVVSQGVSSSQVGEDATAKLFTDMLVQTQLLQKCHLRRVLNQNTKISRRFIKVKPPPWHDSTSEAQFREIKQLSSLLHKNPCDPWVQGKLKTESNNHKQVLNKQQPLFVNRSFTDLESIEQNDPKGYFKLSKKMKTGCFDKNKQSDTETVCPSEWISHFKDLLGKQCVKFKKEELLLQYVKEIIYSFVSELNNPFNELDVKNSY